MAASAYLSDEALADDICTWAGRVAAGTARLLGLVAEFDRRQAWAGTGMLSCAHWLTWRIQLSPGTAREWVRVAHRLEQLPTIRAAFAAGSMSWSQARAITRVATDHDGIDWVDLARHSTAAQLERIVRGVRRAQQAEEAAADRESVAHRLRTRHRYDADGNLVLTIYAPAEDAPLILAGIEAQRAELERQRTASSPAPVAAPTAARHGPDAEPADGRDLDAGQEPAAEQGEAGASPPDVPAGTPPEFTAAVASYQALVDSLSVAQQCLDPSLTTAEGTTLVGVPAGTPTTTAPISTAAPASPEEHPAVTDAQALVAMARAVLDTQRAKHPDLARRVRADLVVQIDPLSGWARQRDGELLPPSSLTSIAKSLPGRSGGVRLRPLTPADLTRSDLGRRQREVSPALRQLLGTLDGERCRFPGCTRKRKLHAHHVVYWSRGGPADLANLVLVCSRHHTLIHQLGFQLVLHPDRSLDVSTPEGTRLLHHPAQPWGDPQQLDPAGDVSAGALAPDGYDRLDLGYVVNVLLQQAA